MDPVPFIFGHWIREQFLLLLIGSVYIFCCCWLDPDPVLLEFGSVFTRAGQFKLSTETLKSQKTSWAQKELALYDNRV